MLVAVGLVVGACSPAQHRADPIPTTVGGPDPYVVPAVITPAYVDAVFVVLEHVAGNATRSLLASHAVTPQVVKDVRAIYNDPLYSQELKIASQDLTESRANVLNPLGDVTLTVVRLISSSAICIFAQTAADFSAVLRHPELFTGTVYWGLKRKASTDDPSDLNRTPWAFFFNAVYTTPTTIPDQCAL